MKIIEQTPNQLKLQSNYLMEIIVTAMYFSVFIILLPLVIGMVLISDNFWFGSLLVGLSIIVPLVILTLCFNEIVVSTIWTFDKSLDLVALEEHYFRDKKITKWQLSKIKQVEVEENITRDAERADTITYSVRLKVKRGVYIPVRLQGIINQKEGYEEIAEFLREFLNLEA